MRCELFYLILKRNICILPICYLILTEGIEMTEYVARVDDYDNVIEVVTREEAGKNGYNVRIAAVLVFNDLGEILLQKVSSKKKKDAGKWSYSAAGHVDAGEDYPTAALRELKEELGIDGEIEDYIGLSRTIDPVTKQKKSFHRAYKVIHNGPFDFDRKEADEIRFFSIPKLSSMIKAHPEMFKANLIDILSIMGI